LTEMTIVYGKLTNGMKIGKVTNRQQYYEASTFRVGLKEI